MTGDLLPQEANAKAEAAARKALELDDSLAEAHNAMCAWYLFYAWDLSRADAECRRGLELDPNSSMIHLSLRQCSSCHEQPRGSHCRSETFRGT